MDASPVNEWRHRQLDPANDSRCHADLQRWPCDAETERNKRLEMAGLVNREHEKHAAAEARALAAEGERDAIRAAAGDDDLIYALTWYFEGRPQSERGVKAFKRLRAALTGAKE